MTLPEEAGLEANPAPGYSQHPDHAVTCSLQKGTVLVTFEGSQIARSTAAFKVTETNHKPVWYIPPEDVNEDYLRTSARTTRCPFKGKARYWNIRVGNHEIDNAVWAYETPYDEVLELAGMMAFYDTKVSIEIEET